MKETRGRTRRHFTAEQKAEAVRRHVAGKEAVSGLAEELGLQSGQIILPSLARRASFGEVDTSLASASG